MMISLFSSTQSESARILEKNQNSKDESNQENSESFEDFWRENFRDEKFLQHLEFNIYQG